MIKKFQVFCNGKNYIVVNELNKLAIKPNFSCLSLDDLEEHKQALLKLKEELKELTK